MTTIEGFADQVISDESADQLKIPKYGNFFQPKERAKIEKKNGLPLNLNRLKTRYLNSILSFPWAQPIQKFV